jgi:serine/threonine protein kinase
MLDIARGLEYLHLRKPSVIHRDCKSSNILVTAKGIAKIADFGLAKVKQSTRSMVRSLVGTVNWQAPELWHAHPKYNYKVDVFSCAMVYWEMLQWHILNKKFPWEVSLLQPFCDNVSNPVIIRVSTNMQSTNLLELNVNGELKYQLFHCHTLTTS